MSLREDIQRALAALGGTSEEVAATLRARGIKGALMTAESCPVANYLRGEVPGLAHMGVDASHVLWQEEAGFTTQEIPQAVYHFVEDFDCNRYPDLEECS